MSTHGSTESQEINLNGSAVISNLCSQRG